MQRPTAFETAFITLNCTASLVVAPPHHKAAIHYTAWLRIKNHWPYRPFSCSCLDSVRASKKRLTTVKDVMFRDSQKLYALRQEEANLIAEICGAQVKPYLRMAAASTGRNNAKG